MNEEQKKKFQQLRRDIVAQNFYLSKDMNFNSVYHSLIPGMEDEMRSSEEECLDIIKSRPEIVDQIIGKYLDEKHGIYVYDGEKYRKDKLIKAIFYSNNASRNMKNRLVW